MVLILGLTRVEELPAVRWPCKDCVYQQKRSFYVLRTNTRTRVENHAGKSERRMRKIPDLTLNHITLLESRN